MKINDLFEARRNANHPAQQVDRIPGKGQKPLTEFLKPYLDQDDVYASFTSLPKLGINPKSIHQTTPNGIYAYPLQFMKNDILANDKEAFPLGADRPWVNIIRVKKPLQDVKKYSKEQFTKDAEQLKIKDDTSNSNSFLSKILLHNKQFKQLMSLSFQYSKYKHNKWAKVLYDLGYAGFVDYGNGWIYPDEPAQAVIFNLKDIELIERINLKTKDTEYTVYDEKQKNPDRVLTNILKHLEKIKNNPKEQVAYSIHNITRFNKFGHVLPQNVLFGVVKFFLDDVYLIPNQVLPFLDKNTVKQLIDDTTINWKRIANTESLVNKFKDEDMVPYINKLNKLTGV